MPRNPHPGRDCTCDNPGMWAECCACDCHKKVACTECNDTGVIETGNNDLPCDCPAGDTAKFNVAGRGVVMGAELKREYSTPRPTED